MPEDRKEIEPPWVYAPEFEPGRAFWRQEGELWFIYVWLPYWESLNPGEREKYLIRWNVPEEWQKYSYHINPEYKEFVDSLDSPAVRYLMSSDNRVNENGTFTSVTSLPANRTTPFPYKTVLLFLLIVSICIAWIIFSVTSQ